MDWRKPHEPEEQIGGERRSDRRYEIALELRWKVLRRKKTLDSGVGRTVDLSSGSRTIDTVRVTESPDVTLAHKNKYGADYVPPPSGGYGP